MKIERIVADTKEYDAVMLFLHTLCRMLALEHKEVVVKLTKQFTQHEWDTYRILMVPINCKI